MLQLIKTSDNVTQLFDTVAGVYVGYILTKKDTKGAITFSVYGNPHFFLKSFGSLGAAIQYCTSNLGSKTDDFEDDYSGDSSDALEYVKSVIGGN
jgi:hypothetical protein